MNRQEKTKSKSITGSDNKKLMALTNLCKPDDDD